MHLAVLNWRSSYLLRFGRGAARLALGFNPCRAARSVGIGVVVQLLHSCFAIALQLTVARASSRAWRRRRQAGLASLAAGVRGSGRAGVTDHLPLLVWRVYKSGIPQCQGH